ncbi:PoNe immunity protein domain-containing protein [Burkholderia sp. LMU1-1-1.1]|uniref:PoNe immunity protein domain-containing protein n=1 Tax=Burkholderia sp. LMU1-1-1.1 TaxID=3135266 RepID=UPI003432C58B
MSNISMRHRQIYLCDLSYKNTLSHINTQNSLNIEALEEDLTKRGRKTTLLLIADNLWTIFKLKYTAGETLTLLANSLDEIVSAFEAYVAAANDMPDDQYYPPFLMSETIDTYVDYLNLLCAAVLLRREDLIPRIHGLNEGTDFDGTDAVLEELLKFYIPDRPQLDDWLWDKPYRKLLDAIDSETPEDMAGEMQLYVKNWYKDMKGVAHFWGKHEKIVPEYTSYLGYWAMCAGAFTYLYDIDDSSYRDEMVYPKDLVDYARKIPRPK